MSAKLAPEQALCAPHREVSFTLAPPTRLAHADELELGTHIRYSHLACVARWHTKDTRTPEWRLTEGAIKGWRPRMSEPPPDFDARDLEYGFISDPWYERRHDGSQYDLVNKTVIVWPAVGEGVVFGLVRRGIGHSYPASGGTGMFDDSWEPGGFSVQAYVPLYAVKTQLGGLDYLLVPPWACEPI